MSPAMLSIHKFFKIKRKKLIQLGKTIFWFGIGVILGLFFLVSFAFITFQRIYNNTIYPGVMVNNVNFGGKTEAAVASFFDQKNHEIADSTFTITANDQVATISARELRLGYDSQLLAHQAYSVGRSADMFSNASIVFQAYISGISLNPAYGMDNDLLLEKIQPMVDSIKQDPTDAVFSFQNGRVTTFRPSANGQEADIMQLEDTIREKVPYILARGTPQSFTIPLPIKTLKPKISTEDVNNLGIKELIGVGTSLFQHSIPGRIYNVNLAATRVNGVIVNPGEEFSFAKAVGDVSSFTGYQQAYIIQNGKTILGDGGGVCQVSTTLFRAALNAGLPITERHAHAYRVGYYEEDSPPGIDATVYVPSVDLKFKNDTAHAILIQSVVDLDQLRLTFYIYGTSDGRKVSMTTPVVTNQTPPPPDLYTDDPTLPARVIKQVDFAAWGAHVSFSRTVTKGNASTTDTFVSDFRPWQAAFLRGTGT